MKIRPLADRILMIRVQEKTVTTSGLIIPKGTTQRQDIADVLNIGKDVTNVVIGDKVLYKPYSTLEITIDDDEFLIIEEKDITAVVEE